MKTLSCDGSIFDIVAYLNQTQEMIEIIYSL